MIDREKVIEGLECCCSPTVYDCDHKCPYRNLYEQRGFNKCMGALLPDALSLLREQEPKPMIKVEDDDLYAWSPEDVSYYCPRPECGKEISYEYNFCPYCGQAVKQDD